MSPTPAEYAAVLASTVRRELVRHGFTTAGLCLEIEPGRAIYATSGLHLARVVNVKEQRDPVPRTWIETDTSEAFLPDVNLEHARWPTILPEKGAASPTQTADVVGCSCGFDLLVPDARLPEVTPGDLIVLLVTGAYQDAGANNFNALPRPAVVLVSGAQAEVIKRRETIAEVFARDVVPERLGGTPPWESDTAVGAPPLDTGSAADPRGRSDRDREASPSRRAQVADLERSLAFYRDLLGLTVTDEGEGGGPDTDELVGAQGMRFRYAELDLGADQLLELIQPLGPAAFPQARSVAPPLSGAHVGLLVDDIGETYRRLRRAGCPDALGPGCSPRGRCLAGSARPLHRRPRRLHSRASRTAAMKNAGESTDTRAFWVRSCRRLSQTVHDADPGWC